MCRRSYMYLPPGDTCRSLRIADTKWTTFARTFELISLVYYNRRTQGVTVSSSIVYSSRETSEKLTIIADLLRRTSGGGADPCPFFYLTEHGRREWIWGAWLRWCDRRNTKPWRCYVCASLIQKERLQTATRLHLKINVKHKNVVKINNLITN